MRPSIHILKSVLCIPPVKYPINLKRNSTLLRECKQLLQLISRTIQDALQSDIPSQGKNIDVQQILSFIVLLTTEIADGCDQTTPGDTVKALAEGLATSYFEYDVRAVVLGVFEDFFLPVR